MDDNDKEYRKFAKMMMGTAAISVVAIAILAPIVIPMYIIMPSFRKWVNNGF